MTPLDIGALVVELPAHDVAPGKHGLRVPCGGHGEARGPGRGGGGVAVVPEALGPVVHVDGWDVEAGVLGDIANCDMDGYMKNEGNKLRALAPGLLIPPSGRIFSIIP